MQQLCGGGGLQVRVGGVGSRACGLRERIPEMALVQKVYMKAQGRPLRQKELLPQGLEEWQVKSWGQ